MPSLLISDSSQLHANVSKKSSMSVPSGTEAEDTGDELLESAFRSAAQVGPRMRGERKRSQYRHRKSCMYYSCAFSTLLCLLKSSEQPIALPREFKISIHESTFSLSKTNSDYIDHLCHDNVTYTNTVQRNVSY